MIVIPSIKLRDGRTPSPTAVSVARELADFGFSRLHVTQGSTGADGDHHTIEDILRLTDARVQVGGVETTSDVDELMRIGADTVVVGDRGIEEPEWLADVADTYPEAIAVTTAVRDRRVVRRGWVRTLPVDIMDLVDELNAVPLQEIIVTIPSLESAVRFGELSLLEDVAERSRCPIVVAGGVADVNDLRALEHRGVAASILDAEPLLAGVMDGRAIAREFGS
jgi:phosphoribosylformimino-5-aminoimidazole carboxamide ribotide isomerase